MPVLTPFKTVRSEAPNLAVENVLPPGTYRFQLVVVDDSDNESVPAQIAVTVQPRPVFDPRFEVAIDPRILVRDRAIDIGRIRRIPTPIRPTRPGG